MFNFQQNMICSVCTSTNISAVEFESANPVHAIQELMDKNRILELQNKKLKDDINEVYNNVYKDFKVLDDQNKRLLEQVAMQQSENEKTFMKINKENDRLNKRIVNIIQFAKGSKGMQIFETMELTKQVQLQNKQIKNLTDAAETDNKKRQGYLKELQQNLFFYSKVIYNFKKINEVLRQDNKRYEKQHLHDMVLLHDIQGYNVNVGNTNGVKFRL